MSDIQGETFTEDYAIEHPSLEPRGGIDPESDTYWQDLGETRGD